MRYAPRGRIANVGLWCCLAVIVGCSAREASLERDHSLAAFDVADRPMEVSASFDPKIQFWEARLARDPDDDTAPTQLALAYLSKARATGDFGLYQKTEELLLPLVGSKASSGAVVTLLASAKAAQHKFREAIVLAQQVATRDPDSGIAQALLFDAHSELGDLASAEAALESLRRIDPGFPTMTREANLRITKGNSDGALEVLRGALRDAISRGLPTEDITWTYVRIGVTYFNRGDYDLAQKNYQAALNLAPNSYLALEHLAELRAAQAKGDEALHLYARVLELSQAPEFYEAIGAIYEERGDDISADRFYSQAEQTAIRHLDAGDIGFYRYLAAFYSDVRPNVTKAVHFAQADLAVRQDAHTYATLAWALYRAYDFQSSVSAVKKALVVPSQDSAMLCRASKIYRAVGDAERAEQLVSEALRANKMISDSVCRGDLADRGSASS